MLIVSDIRPILEAASQFTLNAGTFSNMFFKGERVMTTDTASIFVGACPGFPDCTLAVKDLMHFLRNVPGGTNITYTETDNAVKFSAGRFKQTIQKIHTPNMPSADHIFGIPFSHIQNSPNQNQIATSWPLISTLGAMTHFSAPEADKEYVALQGVNFNGQSVFSANKFCAAALDVSGLPDFASVPHMRFPLKITKYMLTTHECPTIHVKQDYIWTCYEKYSIITQRSAIQYPPSVASIVYDFDPQYRFMLGAEENQRKETLRRLQIGEAATIPIHATVKNKELVLYTITPEKSRESRDSLPIEHDCPDLTFWFQSGFSFFSRALLHTSELMIDRKNSGEVILGMVQGNGITLYMKSRIVRGVE